MSIDPTAALSSLAPYLGAGGLTLAAAGAIRVLAPALPPLLEKLAEVWRRVQEKRAAADVERAKAEHVEAQTDAAIATMLADFSRRLDACAAAHEKSNKEHAAEVAKLRKRIDAQAEQIAKLREAMARKGITPVDFPAVKE